MNVTAPALLAATLALAASPAALAHALQFTGSFAAEAQGAKGSGTLFLEYDEHGRTLLIQATWTGLSGTTTNAHIHCCTATPTAGSAGIALAQTSNNRLPDFPLGITSGSYTKVIDLTQQNQYGATFFVASGGTTALAEKRLIDNLMSGQAYLNIHTTTFGPGEIRAFVTAVPEPETYALMAAGLGLLALRRRRS